MIKWQIKDKLMTFDEDSHSYYVNDKKCISVTQLLKLKYPRKYANVDEKTLKVAADNGTELHEAIQVFEEYGLDREDLQEFRNYLFLKKRFKFEVLKCEVPILLEYKDLVVCGRLDQVQKIGEQIGLGDIKRTATLDKEYLAYQLNIYRLGYQQCYDQKIEFLKGIHLKDDKRKYVDIPINEKLTYELLDQYIEKEKKENDK